MNDLPAALCAQLPLTVVDKLFYPANNKVSAAVKTLCSNCPEGSPEGEPGDSPCWQAARTQSDGHGIWDGRKAVEFAGSVAADQGLPTTVLNESVVTELRSRYAAGEESSDLATEFEVHWSTARNAIHGVSWQHVPGPVPSRHGSKAA